MRVGPGLLALTFTLLRSQSSFLDFVAVRVLNPGRVTDRSVLKAPPLPAALVRRGD